MKEQKGDRLNCIFVSSSSLPVGGSIRGRSFHSYIFISLAYLVLLVLVFGFIITFVPILSSSNSYGTNTATVLLDRASLDNLPEVQVSNTTITYATQENCTYYTCFDVYKCSHTHSGKMKVYVYPFVEYVDEGVPVTKKITQEFYTILETIIKSPYFTSDPAEACLFVPSIDVLNQNRIRPKQVAKALASLP